MPFDIALGASARGEKMTFLGSFAFDELNSVASPIFVLSALIAFTGNGLSDWAMILDGALGPSGRGTNMFLFESCAAVDFNCVASPIFEFFDLIIFTGKGLSDCAIILDGALRPLARGEKMGFFGFVFIVTRGWLP